MTPQPWPKPAKRKPKARKPMKRVRIKARNAKRGGHAFPKNVDEKYRAFIRAQPCILLGLFIRKVPHWFSYFHCCVTLVQACHVKSRGAGGKDVGNLYPGCASAHEEQHRIGIAAFEKRWSVDLKQIATDLARRYHESGGGT